MNVASLAVFVASLAACALPLPSVGAAPDGIATIGPPGAGEGSWSGERMRGARERLKDVLPGHR